MKKILIFLLACNFLYAESLCEIYLQKVTKALKILTSDVQNQKIDSLKYTYMQYEDAVKSSVLYCPIEFSDSLLEIKDKVYLFLKEQGME